MIAHGRVGWKRCERDAVTKFWREVSAGYFADDVAITKNWGTFSGRAPTFGHETSEASRNSSIALRGKRF